MRLKFTKMHGLGNDFVVVDALARPLALSSEHLKRISDRHFGIGCDQILQIEPPRQPDTDFYYRIFNADGGEVEQCGNGARCFMRYVRDRGLTAQRELRVGTRAGVIVPRLEDDGRVTVDMGVPEFEPSRIPFEAPERATHYALEVDGRRLEISALSMGNPHAVQVVPDIERAPVAAEGPLIERHPRFPQRVNAGYMQIVSRRRILLRVHERGAGETLACGTGACAAVVAGVQRGLLDREVTVTARGGNLGISWAGEGKPVMMTGSAESVFEGEIEL
ncbi:MAG TPA: diaminopimelate epimerase [Burkholderiales bacterium]|nr:diaminopimelate epimerase [Burkholderiales bacterium]